MEAHLQALIDNHISLSQSQISQGSTSHTNIRNILANKSSTDSTFPWLLDGDFLSGSYARGTKLHPLDDIDVLIILDGHGLNPLDKGIQLITHYVRGNQQGNLSPVHNYYNSNGHISSHLVMEVFHKALKESFPNSTIRKDGQAINVRFDSYGLGIDVVPCFHIKAHISTDKDMYYIPSGNGAHDWLKTNPKIDENISNYLHEKHNKKLKDVVRLIKYWNREKNADRIKSYHLETIIWYVFHGHSSVVTSLTEGVQYFFNNARTYLENACPDATGIGDPVDKYMTMENRQLSLSTFDHASNSLRSAGLLNPLSGWKVVFGDKFGN